MNADEKLKKKFKRFKNKYFKDKKSFTGEELEECKRKFLLKEQQNS